MAVTKWECIREAQRIATLKRSAARKERDNKRDSIGEIWKEEMAAAKKHNDEMHISANKEYQEDLQLVAQWLADEVVACKK